MGAKSVHSAGETASVARTNNGKLAEKLPLNPPFTRAQLKNAIPEHCFQRSHLRSFTYLAANLLVVWLCYRTIPLFEASPIAWLVWPIYWFVQGALCTGLWVLAHECGHRAFSPHDAVNDAVGLVLHSALLVPYHSWRISHREHHAYTNHTENDQVFTPLKASEVGDLDLFADGFFLRTAFGRICSMIATLTLGWPAYLIFNTTGRNYSRPGTNHFNPNSPIFADKERSLILLSDAALVVVLGLLGVWAYKTSVATVLFTYGVPYLWVNFWLVLITLLQHTDYAIPTTMAARGPGSKVPSPPSIATTACSTTSSTTSATHTSSTTSSTPSPTTTHRKRPVQSSLCSETSTAATTLPLWKHSIRPSTTAPA